MPHDELRLAPALLAALVLAPAHRAQNEIHVFEGIQGENLGTDVVSLGDVDGDGVADLALGVPKAVTPVGSGVVRIYSGSDGSFLRELDNLGFTAFGSALCAPGDIDGDGAADVGVGAPGVTPASTGWATLFSGATGQQLYAWPGSAAADQLGASAAAPGDVDGDGVPDVAFGAPQGGNIFAPTAGYVRVFSGATGAVLQDLHGDPGRVQFGLAVGAAGDFDADAVPDFVVGGEQSLDSFSIQLLRVLSGFDGSELAAVSGMNPYYDPEEFFGRDCSGVGDLDLDGAPEVAFGDPVQDAVHVIRGLTGTPLYTIQSPGDHVLGWSLAALGDLSGDGVSDLALGTCTHVRFHSGADGSFLSHIRIPEPSACLGYSVAGATDLDGDLLPDVLVGEIFITGASLNRAYVFSSVPVVRYVPSDFATIQAAIDASQDGDAVVVEPGTYPGAIDFGGTAVHVLSEKGPYLTVLEPDPGAQGGSLVTFAGGEGPDSILEGFTVRGGVAAQGAGVFCASSSPTIRDCRLVGNVAGTAGGALACAGANPSVEDCSFLENEAPEGGAVHLSGSSPAFVNCELLSNGSTGSGAAVFSDAGSTPSFDSCSFTANEAGPSSGAIHGEGAGSLTSCIVWGNAPGSFAGAGSASVSYSDVEDGFPGPGNLDADPLFVDPGSALLPLLPGSPCIDAGDPTAPLDPDGSPADMGSRLRGLHVVPIHAPTIQEAVDGAADGDVVYLLAGSYEEEVSLINRHGLALVGEDRFATVLTGPLEGEALRLHTSTGILVLDLSFRGFSEPFRRGISAFYSRFTTRRCTFIGHRTSTFGAAIVAVGNPEVVVEDCHFEKNVAHNTARGGGLYTDTSTVTLRDTVFLENRAGSGGGALYPNSGDLEVKRCLFAKNSATLTGGGAIRLSGTAVASVRSSTFTDNTAAGGPGGALLHESGSISFEDCILWNDAPDEFGGSGSPLATYSDVQGGWPGVGNFDQDPLFALPAAGDYRLLASSPCIDAGNPAGPPDPDGSTADVGAFPFAPLGPPSIEAVSPPAVEAVVLGPSPVTLTGLELHLASAVTVDGQPLPAQEFLASYDPLSGASSLELEMPLVSRLGPVDVQVTSPFGTDATSIQVVPPAAPVLELESGEVSIAQGVDVTAGASPGDLVFFGFSPILSPTVVPGLFSVDIGGGLNGILLVATPTVPAQAWTQVHVDATGFTLGGTAWFQAAVFEVQTLAFPLVSTNVVSGTVVP